jgi:hypothetical protein
MARDVITSRGPLRVFDDAPTGHPARRRFVGGGIRSTHLA